jgi:hypothetical protein
LHSKVFILMKTLFETKSIKPQINRKTRITPFFSRDKKFFIPKKHFITLKLVNIDMIIEEIINNELPEFQF